MRIDLTMHRLTKFNFVLIQTKFTIPYKNEGNITIYIVEHWHTRRHHTQIYEEDMFTILPYNKLNS